MFLGVNLVWFCVNLSSLKNPVANSADRNACASDRDVRPRHGGVGGGDRPFADCDEGAQATEDPHHH